MGQCRCLAALGGSPGYAKCLTMACCMLLAAQSTHAASGCNRSRFFITRCCLGAADSWVSLPASSPPATPPPAQPQPPPLPLPPRWEAHISSPCVLLFWLLLSACIALRNWVLHNQPCDVGSCIFACPWASVHQMTSAPWLLLPFVCSPSPPAPPPSPSPPAASSSPPPQAAFV